MDNSIQSQPADGGHRLLTEPYVWCSHEATLSEDRGPTKGKEEDTTF